MFCELAVTPATTRWLLARMQNRFSTQSQDCNFQIGDTVPLDLRVVAAERQLSALEGSTFKAPTRPWHDPGEYMTWHPCHVLHNTMML